MNYLLWSLGLGLLAGLPESAHLLYDFAAEPLPSNARLHATQAESCPHEGIDLPRITFEVVDWPNVFFEAPEGAWDWSAHAGIAVELINPSEVSVPATLRVDNEGADGWNHCNNASTTVPRGGRAVLQLRFRTGEPEKLWGMRGLPEAAPLGNGTPIDPSRITAFQVFLNRPQREHHLLLRKVYLTPKVESQVSMPFIDRFGQYMHRDWPGKVHEESELPARARQEAQTLAKTEPPAEYDGRGGWKNGPQLEGTGWFRTAKHEGKWWLVTPEGRLFFSLGVDVITPWNHTFVTGREDWFAWLPEREAPPYSHLFTQVAGAHSGAEPIGGKGMTFGFYGANLVRKYGPDYAAAWRGRTYARLRAWGFNTIGNWAQKEVLIESPLPFVATTSISGTPLIEGGTGYWSKMIDVFSPVFEKQAGAAMAWAGDLYGQNPNCIGYFVDNELAWEGIMRGALESPPEQPCRQFLIGRLKGKYGNLDNLLDAWETAAPSWDALRTPPALNEAAEADLAEFLYLFARRYFETVRAACREHAPNQLYLGCRFAGPPRPEVERACAETADVISYNLYQTQIAQDRWVGNPALDAPCIIGEFHFGALDRGMFHTGLVAASDQEDRARRYKDYVRGVAAHPAFVGCHWFQYVDEPTTGRWFDGENYNIGMVSVTDTPYPELTGAAREIHEQVYAIRAGAGQGNS